MANVIKLKKGLDIPLKGQPEAHIVEAPASEYYALVPDDFHGIVPKVVVKPGDKVKVGTPLWFDKSNPALQFVSPVSGEVSAVNRGERRKVLNVTVKSDGKKESVEVTVPKINELTGEQVKEMMLQYGLFPFIKQRPYDVIANPDVAPRDIFVTTWDSAPLAPDFDFVMKGQEIDLQAGIDVLRKLTTGRVYVGIRFGSGVNVKGAHTFVFKGPHPAGNVGVQIEHIAPISKGETVWTLNAFDLLIIGRFFGRGRLDFSRLVALTGSEVKSPCYVRTVLGASVASIVGDNLIPATHHRRYISGNVLTGTRLGEEDYLRAPHSQITVIPEGDDCYELLGWALPGVRKYSISRTFFSWMSGHRSYSMDARLHGGERAIIMQGEYDKVLPMDILPEYLIKAILAFDIDKMENLGIYEIAPEDFALCEFVDTSKLPLQAIIRDGLDKLRKEVN
ncbi:MAG: Na(+)-translocating NADH-quinone reductase subunit A [Porphyromonadaceae bacterium]|nr:Na(+)-translocating NADH-quinone reductase subunit A [Porphyromonadaceae bacterium]